MQAFAGREPSLGRRSISAASERRGRKMDSSKSEVQKRHSTEKATTRRSHFPKGLERRMMNYKSRNFILQAMLSPDQLVLLLECLLQKGTFCSKMLECLQKTYHLREQDAEVRHRWCEMIIKHKYVTGYADVDKFLKEDQAMGVYLYGELMLNEDAKQQEIAYKTFATVRDHMDASSAKVVAEMLFDKERQRL